MSASSVLPELLPRLTGAPPAWRRRLEAALAELEPRIRELERSGDVPHAAFDVLRRHGLLGLTVPADLGGEGATLAEAAEASRAIARLDGGLAHAYGYHTVWIWFVAAYGSEHPGLAGRALAERTARDGLVWASIGSAFGGSGGIRRAGDRFEVSARRGFATGAPLADVLFTQSVSEDDGRLYLTGIPTDRAGVAVSDDWDAVGQRLSASPGVTLNAVPATEADLVAILNPPSEYPLPLQSLMIPAFQSLFALLSVGIAEGALLEAREYVLSEGRPWTHASVERAADDLHILSGFGEQVAAVSAAAALAREAAEQLEILLARPSETTPAQRGLVAELIAAAKVAAHHAGLTAASRIFDLTGARSATAARGLDRHWRNLRTLTLHDPVAYKHEELGRYFLDGELPTPSVYR